MARYKDIQEHVKQKYGYTPKSCWIAHMKELCDFNPRISPNRHSSNVRKYPCPLEKQSHIIESFHHFKMI
jgi:hypothetical protein